MKKLILASKSPYRKALLERLGIQFEVAASGYDESVLKNQIQDPQELTRQLSLAKAKSVKSEAGEVVIGSDQVCVLGQEIMGKPGSIQNAEKQLMKLSGKTHFLITSYAIVGDDFEIVKTNKTALKMRELNSNQVKNYLTKDNPVDCAGAYKLELNGISLMDIIETSDHTAITGLPLIELARDLVGIGFQIPPE